MVGLNWLSHQQWTYNGSVVRDDLVPLSEIENFHILHKAKSKSGSKRKHVLRIITVLTSKEGKIWFITNIAIFSPKV